MQTRYMERSNSIARGKRVLDPGCNEDDQPDKKRPALASVIVEALKMDSLQKLCSSLEPILRKVVSEEVERALVKLGPAKLSGRVSPKRIVGPGGSNLQLQFRSKLALPLFTGGKVEGELGAAIHVILLDANTGRIVTSGSGSSAKLDIVVLEGDFNNEDDDGWTQEEFDTHVVKEREGKRPLLTGDVQVTLKEGVGTIGELTFTDNSSWIRSRKFRLGLKVAAGYCEDIRIRGAKTDAFTVKDHRGELYKKHYPPALNDEVWRLEKIGKDGSFHKRLNKAGISTVEDFLRLVARDLQRLRNILGSGMSNKMWDVLLEHAKTCILSGKLYVYYPGDVRNIGVVFNNIYELSGLIVDNEFHSADSLSDSQKVYVDTLVTKAYDNWMHVIEYDGNSLLSSKVHRDSGSLGSGIKTGPHAYFSSNDHQLSLPTSLPVAVPPEQPSMNPGHVVGGYNDNVINRYPTELQDVHFNSPLQFDVPPFLQSQLDNSPQQIQQPQRENMMPLGPQQSSASGFDGIVADVLKVYLVNHGKQWDGREAQKLVGKTLSEAAAVIIDEYGLSIAADELISEFTPMLSDQWCNIKALPGASRLIKHFRGENVQMALASNSPRANIEAKLSYQSGWKESFSVVIGGDEVTAGKPSPEIFLEAAKKLNIDPSNCLVIEDSLTGVMAAKAAGMEVVAVPSLQKQSHLYTAADEAINSLLDLQPEKWGLPPFQDWIQSTLPIEPWYIGGPVIKGFGRGSKVLGIPTANISTEKYSVVLSEHPSGVYFGWAKLSEGGVYKMVMSIGWNPYFSNSEKAIEPWLLHEFDEDFYGKELHLAIVGYIRPEANFPSLESLVEKIYEDRRVAEAALELPLYAKYKDDRYLRKPLNGENNHI